MSRTTCGVAPAGTENVACVDAPGAQLAVVGLVPKPQFRSGPICPRVQLLVISPRPCFSIFSWISCVLFSSQPTFRRQSGASTGWPSSAIKPVGFHTSGAPGNSGSPASSTNVPSHSRPSGLEWNVRFPVEVMLVVSSHWFGRPALY